MTDSWQYFTNATFELLPTDPQEKYRKRLLSEKKSVQWGQRKLGLALIQFLTDYWNPNEVQNPVLVYAGASPGDNIEYILRNFFPKFRAALYDPRPMKFKVTKEEAKNKYILVQDIFTRETAAEWINDPNTGLKRNDIFFVSDIRSVDYKKADKIGNETGVWEDMKLQEDVYKIMQPFKAQLKFRLPYYYPEVEGYPFPKEVEFLDGKVYKGIWAPQTSTETRLVPSGYTSKMWDIEKYQDQMFYFNNTQRQNVKYYNPFSTTISSINPQVSNLSILETPIDPPELLNDFDSTAEALIWRNYFAKFGQESNVTLRNIIGVSRGFTNFINSKLPSNKQEDKTTLYKLRNDPFFIKRFFSEKSTYGDNEEKF